MGAILDDINKLNERILTGGAFIDVADIDKDITSLHSLIKLLQSICKTAADVSNSMSRLRKFRCGQYSQTEIDIRPTDSTVGHIRLLKEPAVLVECLPAVTVPVVRVRQRSEIPVHPLYYITDEKQFAINIAGCTAVGDIGHIYERHGLRTAACFAGRKCRAVCDGSECEFWHDPRDYLAAGQPVPADHRRNFTSGSFIYSATHAGRAKSVRHVGDRRRLLLDMYKLMRTDYTDEIQCRESQLMHDLLVYLVMNKAGFYAGQPAISNATFLQQYDISSKA